MESDRTFGGHESSTCKGGCNGLAAIDARMISMTVPFRLPRCCASSPLSSEWMEAATQANASLLRYFYPPDPTAAWRAGSMAHAYRPMTSGCRVVPDACIPDARAAGFLTAIPARRLCVVIGMQCCYTHAPPTYGFTT